MNLKEISNEFGMSLSMLIGEIEKGMKYEEKNIPAKGGRLKFVMDCIRESPTYYSEKLRMRDELK